MVAKIKSSFLKSSFQLFCHKNLFHNNNINNSNSISKDAQNSSSADDAIKKLKSHSTSSPNLNLNSNRPKNTPIENTQTITKPDTKSRSASANTVESSNTIKSSKQQTVSKGHQSQYQQNKNADRKISDEINEGNKDDSSSDEKAEISSSKKRQVKKKTKLSTKSKSFTVNTLSNSVGDSSVSDLLVVTDAMSISPDKTNTDMPVLRKNISSINKNKNRSKSSFCPNRSSPSSSSSSPNSSLINSSNKNNQQLDVDNNIIDQQKPALNRSLSNDNNNIDTIDNINISINTNGNNKINEIHNKSINDSLIDNTNCSNKNLYLIQNRHSYPAQITVNPNENYLKNKLKFESSINTNNTGTITELEENTAKDEKFNINDSSISFRQNSIENADTKNGLYKNQTVNGLKMIKSRNRDSKTIPSSFTITNARFKYPQQLQNGDLSNKLETNQNNRIFKSSLTNTNFNSNNNESNRRSFSAVNSKKVVRFADALGLELENIITLNQMDANTVRKLKLVRNLNPNLNLYQNYVYASNNNNNIILNNMNNAVYSVGDSNYSDFMRYQDILGEKNNRKCLENNNNNSVNNNQNNICVYDDILNSVAYDNKIGINIKINKVNSNLIDNGEIISNGEGNSASINNLSMNYYLNDGNTSSHRLFKQRKNGLLNSIPGPISKLAVNSKQNSSYSMNLSQLCTDIDNANINKVLRPTNNGLNTSQNITITTRINNGKLESEV